MAGRGRSATLPAWMTQQSSATGVESEASYSQNMNYSNASIPSTAPGQYDDRVNNSGVVQQSDKRAYEDNGRDRSRQRDGSRERGRDRDRDREKRRRSKSRSRSRDRRPREPSPGPSKKGWRSRKEKASNFDVRPPDGVVLPPIGGMMGAESGFALGPIGELKRDSSATTRHARRIYVGGIPPTSTEHEIAAFFNDICRRGLKPADLPSDGMPPVMNVYLNLEKCFAFVELPSIEIASAAQKLDGIQYKHHSGNLTLRIRRPHDYKPELVTSNGPIPEFVLQEFQTIGTTVTDGAGKVFVGGLPYHLTDEQVKELLSTFGQLKAFNLVRDPGSVLSKGYAFCEYLDDRITQIAIQGLNDMPIGDKKLTVRIADTRANQTSAPGMTQPLQANPFINVTGLGALGQAIPQANNLQGQKPTRVLRLENMVTTEELQDDEEYEDILSDVRMECSQYGQVQTVVIPRAKSGYPPETEGSIFILFIDIDSSTNAAIKLFGRKFAERTVVVNYFDETKFQNGIFT